MEWENLVINQFPVRIDFMNYFLLLLFLFFNCTGPKKEDIPENTSCLQGNCAEGFGIQEFHKEKKRIARYEGTFKNGMYDGEGLYYYENGDRYKGGFKADKMHGYGVYEFFQSGDRYQGEFREDRMDGKGIYYTRKGNRYEGNFKNGKLFGEGKLIRRDGEVFIGSFRDDIPSGKAIIKNKAGKVIFDGEFQEIKD